MLTKLLVTDFTPLIGSRGGQPREGEPRTRSVPLRYSRLRATALPVAGAPFPLFGDASRLFAAAAPCRWDMLTRARRVL